MFIQVDSVMAVQTEEEFAVTVDEAIERSLAEPELSKDIKSQLDARVLGEVKRKHIIIHILFVLNLICT